jgi:hypothetical protein
MKRIAILGLAVLTVSLLLFGCVRDSGYITSNGENSNVDIVEIGPRPVFDIPHRERPVTLFPELVGVLYRVAFYGNGMYMYATSVNEPERGRQIYYGNIDDGSVSSPLSTPDNFRIDNFVALSDGSLIIYGFPASYNEHGGLDWNDENYRIYHSTQEQSKLLIQGTDRPLHISNAIAVSEQDEQIFTLTLDFPDSIIHVYAMTGAFLYEIELNFIVTDIIYSIHNNSLYAYGGNEEGDIFLFVLDKEQKTFSEVARWPSGEGFSVHPCNVNGFYAIRGSNVLRFDTATNSLVELFNLEKQGISGWIPFFCEYNDSFIVLVDNVATSTVSITKFKVLEDYNGPVEVLRLGKFEAGRDSLLEEIVTEFNFFNPQYYIEVVDYSMRGDEAAATHLHLDILKKEAPDILLLSEPFMPLNHLPIHSYIAGGALADLAPYMARDLNPDNFWENVIRQLYTGHSCYIAVPSFSLFSIIGTSSAIDDLRAMSTTEFFTFLKDDLMNENPQLAANMTHEQFVIDLVLANMGQFIDYNSGTVSFESNEFITLLEAAYALTPAERRSSLYDVISFARKQRQLAFLRMSHFGDFQSYASALYGDFSIIGFPGSGEGVALIPQHIFGISSSAQNIEGAWAFLRAVYEYENMHNLIGVHFPMNKVSFSQFARNYETVQEANLRRGWGATSIQDPEGDVHFPPIAPEQIYEITALTQTLINNVDSLYLVDSSIVNIINEELPMFFHGGRTASDTARIIQSRTQTYLWELG